MRLLKFMLIVSLLAAPALAGIARAAETAAPEAGKAEEGLPARAVELWNIPLPGGGHFPITNSMFVTWMVAIGIIVFAELATRNMKPVPEGAQKFWAWIVEGLYNVLASIVGLDLVKKTLWFFARILIF